MITAEQSSAINNKLGTKIKPNTPIYLQVGHHGETNFGLIHLRRGNKPGRNPESLYSILSGFDEIYLNDKQGEQDNSLRVILVKRTERSRNPSVVSELTIGKYFSVVTQYSNSHSRLNNLERLWSKNPHHARVSPSDRDTGFRDANTRKTDGSNASGAIPQSNNSSDTGNIPHNSKSVNYKHAQSIIDIMYTWKLPPVQNNGKLFIKYGVTPEKLGAYLDTQGVLSRV